MCTFSWLKPGQIVFFTLFGPLQPAVVDIADGGEEEDPNGRTIICTFLCPLPCALCDYIVDCYYGHVTSPDCVRENRGDVTPNIILLE